MGERVRREDLQIVTYTHEDWVMAYSDADGRSVTALVVLEPGETGRVDLVLPSNRPTTADVEGLTPRIATQLRARFGDIVSFWDEGA